ncbi:ABC-three component system middle component 1 [Rhizobium sp. FKL33]|uniref:ABC-three component system middle component 1 n=1 Tax=Rhizobium sp. FKL33 TaxID=2562307 RepID=UPI0010BF9775|nr:ABC-three component system middle component 1 [Rhizobium sp. FKL33]
MTDGLTLSPGLADFAERIRSAAQALDLKVKDRAELASATFNGGSSKSTSISPTDLPAESHGVRIDRFNVVLGVLPDIATLEAVRETLRRYRNQCVIARSYLGTNETLDLQLMLLGPRSSERQDAWRALALMVERDDRVARKLAWLRPADEKRDEESFTEFLKRTFLARPWVHAEGKFEDVALDELSSGNASSQGLPRTLADEWERIALDENNTPDDIVSGLVKAWERRGLA